MARSSRRKMRVTGRSEHRTVPVVRWLGAFGRGPSLAAAVDHELARPATDEVAAEPIWARPRITSRAGLGLLIDQSRSTLVRAWQADAWTERDEAGRLVPSRGAGRWAADWRDLVWLGRDRSCGGHGEAIVRGPRYVAVVYRDRDDDELVERAVMEGRRAGLPAVWIHDPRVRVWSRGGGACGWNMITYRPGERPASR